MKLLHQASLCKTTTNFPSALWAVFNKSFLLGAKSLTFWTKCASSSSTTASKTSAKVASLLAIIISIISDISTFFVLNQLLVIRV